MMNIEFSQGYIVLSDFLEISSDRHSYLYTMDGSWIYRYDAENSRACIYHEHFPSVPISGDPTFTVFTASNKIKISYGETSSLVVKCPAVGFYDVYVSMVSMGSGSSAESIATGITIDLSRRRKYDERDNLDEESGELVPIEC